MFAMLGEITRCLALWCRWDSGDDRFFFGILTAKLSQDCIDRRGGLSLMTGAGRGLGWWVRVFDYRALHHYWEYLATTGCANRKQ